MQVENLLRVPDLMKGKESDPLEADHDHLNDPVELVRVFLEGLFERGEPELDDLGLFHRLG